MDRRRSVLVLAALACLALGSQADAETAASPTALANTVLSLPQRKPCDVNLFTSKFVNGANGAYPAGGPMAPAAGPALPEGQVRGQLAAFMPAGTKRAKALRLFDQPEVKAKIAPPSLRAAYAAMVGTIGESTIEAFAGSTFERVTFNGLPNAAVIANSSGGRLIAVNNRYEREHFGLLVGIMAHEILHHDWGNTALSGGAEEAILNAITALIHMQVLSRHPELVAARSELVRQTNGEVLLWTNSRAPRSPTSALIVPNGNGVAPGSARNARDFWTIFKGGPGVSPAPDALRAVLRAILKPGVRIPKLLTFSQPTARLFGQLNDSWLSPVERVRISVLLGLVSVDGIVKATKLTRAKAVQTFRLAAIKSPCGT